jgi:hypothetical protein
MAQGDYQALAKLAAEEPRLARLKVRSVLLSVYHLFIYLSSAAAESEIRRGTSSTSRAFEAAREGDENTVLRLAYRDNSRRSAQLR